MFESLRFTVILLLVLHARDALAADDIDEKVAIVIFSTLIAIFSGIAILFAFLIIRLKRQDCRQASRRRDVFDSPGSLDKSKRDILRINSDHGITSYHQSGSSTAAFDKKTPNDFPVVYLNPGYSPEMDLVLDTTSTFQQPPVNEKSELNQHPQDSVAQNFGNTENTSSDVNTVTLNENFVDEDSPTTQEKDITPVDEHNDTKSTIVNDTSVSTDNDNNKDNKSSSSVIANGVTVDGVTSSAHESRLEPVHDHASTKRKSPKRYESQESQKPLLFSQSSTTSSVTADSPVVGGLQHQISAPDSAFPDPYNESDEHKQDNEESEL